MSFFPQLFSSGGFQPHGFCYQWNSGLVWLNAASDMLIAAAYFTIPVTLAHFIRKRRDLPFSWMFALFGLFIVACGTTHALEVWNLWHAQYWLAGIVKSVTASVSIITAVLLSGIVPKALALPNSELWRDANAALQQEVRERQVLEANLRTNEARYREIAELLDLTHDAIFVRNLKNEVVYWNAGAETLYGWKQEEALGKAAHALLQTVFPAPREEIDARVLELGGWEGELIHRRRDGTPLVVSSRWALRKSADGTPQVILESNRDVTERQKEELKFRNLLEAAPDAIVIVNRAGKIQLINTQTEKLFGYNRTEIIGKDVEIMIPDRFQQSHQERRDIYIHTPRPRPMGEGKQLFGRRKDGTEFPVEISLSPIETSDETLISASIRDVTERKRNEEKLREIEIRFGLFISGLRDYAMLMLDKDGTIISWNAGAERINGYCSDEILSQHFSKLYTPEDLAHGKPALELKIATERGRYEEEGWRLRKDGSRFWASVVITAVHDEQGQLRGFGKVTKDVTARKIIEEKLETQNKEVSRANERLVEANQELESFSYSVSHDLRAPLRAIDGFSHALLEDCLDKLDDQDKHHLGRIRAATQQMGMLIDDLLNLSRITRAQMQIQDVDLSGMVHSLIAEMQKADPERRVDLQVEEGLRAAADRGLMKIALVNLLSNAWKFTSKRACGSIEFGNIKVRGATAFFVRDNGAGFDPAYAGRLFGAFQRLHSTFEFPGTGVGLATVQRIVRRHGGHIWSESAVDQGATFYFTLNGSPS
jgi:PAS domain S-box-containing protein